VLRRIYNIQHQELRLELFGLKFENPVGLAAGFDKQGYIYRIIADIGFGHMEIGSISLLPWRGNPSPTLLRLPRDWGLINRLGLNSEGADAVKDRLSSARFAIPTGLNLVKTADPAIAGEEAIQDYLQSFVRLYPLADFITLNLSCPNTIEGRTFEDPELLAPFLKRLKDCEVQMARRSKAKPVLVKLSPDLDDNTLDRILDLARDYGLSGCVIANTTNRREELKTPGYILHNFGCGGLSGLPLKKYVQKMVRQVWIKSEGRLPIIACGGVGCDPKKHPAEDVWEYLNLGASLVQLHTGLIYRGPSISKLINNGLREILSKNKLSSLTEFFARRADNTASRAGQIPL
jgi:dihydroorotate dehydrogenase